MNITIIKGNMNHLEECSLILQDSLLGEKYFKNSKNEYIGSFLLKEGFDKEEIYVATDENGKCVGFAWIIVNGIFHWFPFLHVLAVKKELRGKGIGKQLMAFFEELGFSKDHSDKIFLCVDDFSIEAMELYKKLGYKTVGPIPDMFIPGVITYLMMKTRN